MTIAACFVEKFGPPVFLTDVLVTIKEQGQHVTPDNKWHKQVFPPSDNVKEVGHIRKSCIINAEFCVAWAGDVGEALEAIRNLEKSIMFTAEEDINETMEKIINNIKDSQAYSLIIARVFKSGSVFKHQVWASNCGKFDFKNSYCLVAGSGFDFLRKSEFKFDLSFAGAAGTAGEAFTYACTALATCLVNEVSSASFSKFRLGAYYEMVIWDGEWKHISLPVNFVTMSEQEDGEKIYRFVSRSYIVETPVAMLSVAFDPLELYFEGDFNKIISSIIINPFRNEVITNFTGTMNDMLIPSFQMEIVLVYGLDGVWWKLCREPLFDFTGQSGYSELNGVFNGDFAREIFSIVEDGVATPHHPHKP